MTTVTLKPQQVVCFSHAQFVLYGEVIQVIESRGYCWVRPLFLLEHCSADSDTHREFDPSACLDMRGSSDLVYPLHYFRPAHDEELIPLLPLLADDDPSRDPSQKAKHQAKLWQFLDTVS